MFKANTLKSPVNTHRVLLKLKTFDKFHQNLIQYLKMEPILSNILVQCRSYIGWFEWIFVINVVYVAAKCQYKLSKVSQVFTSLLQMQKLIQLQFTDKLCTEVRYDYMY